MTNDAALPSMAAGRIVVVVGALLLFAGCEPSLNSSDPYERIRALDTLTNPEALANVAIHDEVWVVRLAAVEKLTDQTPIAKLAIDDENLSVRLAAVEKLTDQTALAKIAVHDKDPEVCKAAVKQLTPRGAVQP